MLCSLRSTSLCSFLLEKTSPYMLSMFVQLNIIYTFYIKTWLTLFETEIVKQNNWGRLNLMGMGFNQPTNQEKAKKFLEGQLLWGTDWILWNSRGSWELSDLKGKILLFYFFWLKLLVFWLFPGEESICINNFYVIDNSYNVQTFIEFQVFLPYPFIIHSYPITGN